MPELPELEIIAQKITAQLTGKSISRVIVHEPLLIYGIVPDDFITGIEGTVLHEVHADGKFLVFLLNESRAVVTNPMLTGRFTISENQRARTKKYGYALIFENHIALNFSDSKRMSRTYLVKGDNYSSVSGFEDRGPSPLDPELTFDRFHERLRKYRGQIKNVLRNQRFVKGIGNAYADEILLYAGILPFRKCTTLSDEEVQALYSAMRMVLLRYRELLSRKTLDEIASHKRDYLMIHGRGGGICPLCGGRISEISANRIKTNYCQACQT
ncbi:MAG: Fpg/Nei family DNA glycosylase [Candidatus Thorarchaeota archaeon]